MKSNRVSREVSVKLLTLGCTIFCVQFLRLFLTLKTRVERFPPRPHQSAA